MITYSVNQSDVTDVTAHLLRVEGSFEPTLGSRVDIRAYAQKLNDFAVRFEAWMDGELVGLIATYSNYHDSGKAFVSNVSVIPECRGQGVATRLMLQCIKHVHNLGFDTLELDVDQRSSAAVALYRRLGFNTIRAHGNTLSLGRSIERQAE